MVGFLSRAYTHKHKTLYMCGVGITLVPKVVASISHIVEVVILANFFCQSYNLSNRYHFGTAYVCTCPVEVVTYEKTLSCVTSLLNQKCSYHVGPNEL